jgi:Gpi18-like mannosyltransferase
MYILNRLVYLDEILYLVMTIKVTSIISELLSVFPPLIIFNRLAYFHVSWYRCNAILGDFDAIIFNPIENHF